MQLLAKHKLAKRTDESYIPFSEPAEASAGENTRGRYVNVFYLRIKEF